MSTYYYPKSWFTTTTTDTYDTYYYSKSTNTSSNVDFKPIEKKEEKVLFDVKNLYIGE